MLHGVAGEGKVSPARKPMVRKAKVRRIAARERAVAILRSMESGTLDAYLGYRALYAVWCGRNAAVQELRPLFRIEGIEPDGTFSVTDEFRRNVLAIARQILPLFKS
jgi:hypothetical protein